MKLIAEDVKNDTEENECGVFRNSDSMTKVKWKSEPDSDKKKEPVEEEIVEDDSIMSAYQEGGEAKTERKVVLRKKEDMEKTTATMDALIQGVTKCRIQGEGEGIQAASGKEDEGEGTDLAGKLSQLTIETKEFPSKRKEPKEDDERGSNRSSESEEEEENKPRVRLVKLEPPVPSKESNDDDEAVITRGPAGIPVYHKRTNGNNRQPVQQAHQMPLMPENFPDYQQMYNGMGHPNGSVPMAAMGKRCMEPQDLYPEAPKYVRPQHMIMAMPQSNLDAPGTPLPTNANMPLSPTSFRPHSTVCVNQMAGGTVFAAEENPALCQLPPPHQQQQMAGWVSGDYQQRLYPSQESYGFPGNNDFLEEAVNAEEEGRVDSEEIERLLLDAVAANKWKNDLVINKDVENLLWPNSSSPQMAPVPMPTRPAVVMANQQRGDYMRNHPQQGGHTPDLQMTFQDKQHQSFDFYPPTTTNNSNSYAMMYPSPHRNSLEDTGYATDQSPSHESSQFSPSPSSVMAASPASSPPYHQNWSPPPSNMSQDSGVASPMSEDGKSHYGQIKSPRSVRSMSEMASPPHPSSAINMATPGFMSQPHQSPNPYQDIMLPLDYPPTYNLDFTEDPNYQDSYIDANLSKLDLAIQVAENDVKEDISKLHNNVVQPQQQLQQQQQQQQWLWQQQQQQQQQHVVKKGTQVVQPSVMPTTALNINPATAVNINPATAAAGQVQQGRSMPHMVLATGNFSPKTATAADMTTLNSRMLQNTAAAIITSTPTTLAFTTAPAAPLVTRNGKVQIPHNNPKVQQPPMSNVMLGTVIVMPPSKPRYQPIAPKNPTKQDGTATANSGNISNGVAATGKVASSSNGCQGTAATPAPTSRISPENILNQARRYVADLGREELQNKDGEGDTILHIAICQTDGPYLVKALLERLERENLISLIDTQNNNGQTPLYLAVRINDHGKVKVLVEQGADVTVYANYNGTKEKKAAIHCASSNGHTYLQTLKTLLSAPGMKVEQPDLQGYTALHCAILNHGKSTVIHKKKKSETIEINSIPIVEALVAAGANPNLQVQNGRTALMIALETGCLDLFEKLLSLVNPTEREKCLKTQDFKGNSVLKIADRLKGTLEPADQLRLQNCLKRNSFQRNSGSGS